MILERVRSVGSIAQLPSPDRDRVMARVQAVIDTTPELAGRPEVAFPNLTFAYDCRALPTRQD